MGSFVFIVIFKLIKMFKTIIEDTLKNSYGKYSRKSLTLLLATLNAVISGLYILFSNLIIDNEINKYSIEVFNGWLILMGALVGATVFDKIKGKVADDQSE